MKLLLWMFMPDAGAVGWAQSIRVAATSKGGVVASLTGANPHLQWVSCAVAVAGRGDRVVGYIAAMPEDSWGDLSALETGDAHHFGDWSNSPAPRGPTGVYTIWRGEEFVYAGMAYRDATEAANPQARGLWGRLASHASGRRSGDQFCIYICDRYVLGELTPADVRAVTDGRLSLDALTRDYIRAHLSYRFLTTTSGAEARAVERVVRGGGLPSGRKPSLNPLREPGRATHAPTRPDRSGTVGVDELWARLARHQGEEFTQIRGKSFRYTLDDAGLVPTTTAWTIPRAHFATALERVPLAGTTPVQELFGPSYLYALLMDPRIRATDW